MAITQAMTNSFKVDILSGGMNFNTSNRALSSNTQDAFKIALYTAASASLDATTTVYTTTGEISGTGYTAGGNTLSVSQVPTSSGSPSTTAYINFSNTSWSSATFSADGALIYNSSNSNHSVCVLNFGGTKTVTSGTFTIQFPTAGTGSSIIQIA
jgi:hypothetical protein